MIIYIASDGPDITARVAANRKVARYLIGYDTRRSCFDVTEIGPGAAGLQVWSLDTLAGDGGEGFISDPTVAEVIDLVRAREFGEVTVPA